MRILDISIPIHEKMACFPGTDCPKFEQVRKMDTDGKSVWKYTLTSITGTHIEAPSHSVKNGETVDKIDLDKCIGACQVVAVDGKEGLITTSEIAQVNAERVLFKTSNSSFIRENKFYDDFTALSLEAAEDLVKKGVKLVGIDYYGIERRGTLNHPVHTALLKAGVVILLGLDLSEASPGFYNLIALPTKLQGLDGANCRAVLVEA